MEDARVRHVSNSEIQTWKRCRRKWYLGNYRKLQRIQKKWSGPLSLGTNVHEALAGYYSDAELNPLEVIRELYRGQIEEAQSADVHPDEVKNIQKEFDLALAMIEGYLEWLEDSGVDDGLHVLASEVEMAAKIDSLPVILIGKFDLRVRRESDGALYAMDHKTCGSFNSMTELLDLNEQLLTYELLERLTQPEGQRVVGGMLNMLRKVKRTASAKPPFYMRESVHHNDDELRAFYSRLYGTLKEMVTAEENLDAGGDPNLIVPPTPDSDCSWKCEFRAVCPMMNDPKSHAEALLQTAYKVSDPYARYEMERSVE